MPQSLLVSVIFSFLLGNLVLRKQLHSGESLTLNLSLFLHAHLNIEDNDTFLLEWLQSKQMYTCTLSHPRLNNVPPSNSVLKYTLEGSSWKSS